MNILQIMSDQHMADAMGVAGHAQAITPNLDRLAASGVRCTRAYTNNPVCTPSRVTALSGRYCHNHGYFGLNGPTPTDDLPDFLSHLGKHGHHTAAVGKLHLPKDPHHWLANRVDYHMECCNADSPTNPYVQWARSQGLGDQIDFGGIPGLPGKQQNEARPSTLTYEQTVEGYTNCLAMQFIDGCQDQPWAMQVSYFRPHQCYTPPQQFWDLYDDNLDLPYGWDDYDTSGRAPDFVEFVERWRDRPGLIEPTDPESRFRRVWRGYLACISMIDHAVGELLDHLEARGLADHTAVMYHADHGAYSGMYGLPEKAPGIASDQVCRIPMLWRVPGVTQPGQTTDAFVEQVDVAPTFAALAGAPPMPDPDGFDLTPILRGEDRPFRDCAVTENLWSKAIRWDRWRFVHYHRAMYDGQDHGELYDLDADPLEKTNLYHDPAYRETREEGRRRILEWITHIHAGEHEVVVLWRLDRLSRRLREGLDVLCSWCERGLRVVSVTQQIDFNGATRRMLAAVLLGVAEMELETMRERQRVGIEAARERGVYRGRKPGTTKAKPKRAAELRDKGLTQHEIATALGVSRTARTSMPAQ